MPTDRTPEQWAEFCAGVMGWTPVGDGLFLDHSNGTRTIYRTTDPGKCYWSPWNNPADALEVLERMATIMSERNRTDPEKVEISLYSHERDLWGACLEFEADWVVWAEAPGPHFGPAVCGLAGKIIGDKHAQDK